MFGYIYKTTDLSNGKIYIGKHHSTKYVGLRYVGSGLIITNIKNKCKRDHIPLETRLSIEMIDSADTLEDLNVKEVYWIDRLNARDPSVGYNKRRGGDCGPGGPQFKGHKHSIETRKSFSENRRGANNSNFGNHWKQSDELRERHRELSSGERNGMFGKKQTQHQRDLDRLAHKDRKKMSHEIIYPAYRMIKDTDIDAYLTQGWFLMSAKVNNVQRLSKV